MRSATYTITTGIIGRNGMTRIETSGTMREVCRDLAAIYQLDDACSLRFEVRRSGRHRDSESYALAWLETRDGFESHELEPSESGKRHTSGMGWDWREAFAVELNRAMGDYGQELYGYYF